MKKTLAFLLVIIMAASCFAGCSGKTSAETTGAAQTASVTEPAVTEAPTEPVTEPATEPVTAEPVTTEPATTEEPETEPVTFGEFVIEPDESATLAVSRVYSDHMVIQRDVRFKVWGTSNKDGAEIRGLFMDDEARATVADGKWEMTFSPKAATAEPQILTIDDSCGNTVKFEDVLVGDVYVVGGQSNAEITLANYWDVANKQIYDNTRPLRLFQQGADYVIAHKKDAKEPWDDVENPQWSWKTATKANSVAFSALGYFLGDKLVDETGVPIGVVVTAANGAKINELMPENLVTQFKYKVGGNVSPSAYYNVLVHPFLNMQFKAMVFFQGESEGFTGANPTPKKYARDFEALMTEYRRLWGFDFPIYNVQLSDYTAEGSKTCTNVGLVRSQQYDAYKAMTGIRLIPSYDLGSKEGYSNYFHSPYKKELAQRIAAIILAEQYGKGVLEDTLAPEPVEIKLSDDKTYFTVKFKNVGEGLKSTSGDNKVSGFAVGKIAKLTAAEAEIISADTVKVYVPEGANTSGIGYAAITHVTSDTVQLYNSHDIPALAFYLEVK